MRAHIPIVTLMLLLTPAFVPGLTAATVNAEVIHVCWDGSGDYLTIQEGIDAAQDGDEVVVCDGTYTGPLNKNLDFHGKAITVRSANGPDNCIIDCEDDGRGVEFVSGETLASILDSFTITNGDYGAVGCFSSSPTIVNCVMTGNTGFAGGAICCYEGSNPTITDCTMTVNHAWALGARCPRGGGGVYCENGSDPTVADCTITGNTATSGGGGIACTSSAPLIANCKITGNTAYKGGAISCSGGTPTITNCLITENEAQDRGGGIRCSISSPTITNCTIAGNSAAYGGGVHSAESAPAISNCAILANTANHDGGAIYCRDDTHARIVNCTIAANFASTGRALASASPYYGGPSNVEIANCILWDGADEIRNYDESTINVTYSDVFGDWPGAGNIDADPLFVDPDGPDDDPNTWEDNDFHLSGGSPCIDAGCNWGVSPDLADLDNDGDTSEYTPFDLDSEGRFFDDPNTDDSGCTCPPIVDMGAYEFGETGPQPCPGDLDCDRDVDELDLGILLAAWHVSGDGDLNCDGVTDHADLGIVLGNWGNVCP